MDLTKANGMLESIKAIMDRANEKIEVFCSDNTVEQNDNKPVFDTKSDNDSSFSNIQCKKFVSYVKEVVANFKETGSLRGISTIAREYGVSSLTKEQFFRYGLNNEVVTDEYIISVYEKAKKHL